MNKTRIKYLLRESLANNTFNPNNPDYKDAWLNHGGGNDEDTWEEYNGLGNIKMHIEDIKKLKFPLTIYRGLNIEKPEDFKQSGGLDNVDGTSWTTDFDIAKKFSQGRYVVTAILQKDNIDWKRTIERNIMHDALGESEINVLDPMKLKIISINK